MSSTILNWSGLQTGNYTGADSLQWIGSVNTDASGNIYQLVNTHYGNTYVGFPITLYNSNGTVYGTYTVTSAAQLVIKRNSEGTIQWYGVIQTTTDFNNVALEVDSAQNVYVAGGARAAVTIRGSNATTATIARTGSNSNTAFFAKWNSSGVVQFGFNPLLSANTTSSSYTVVQDMKLQGSNIYLVVEGAPGLSYTAKNVDNTNVRSSVSAPAYFLIKYNTSGVGSAAFVPLSGGNARAVSIEVDSSENIYICGWLESSSATYTLRSSTNGLSETTTSMTMQSSTSRDGYIIKYNSSFTAQWILGFIGSGGNDMVYDVMATTTGILCGFQTNSAANTGSIAIRRNNGTLTTLSASVALTPKGGNFFAFDGNGAISWSSKVTPTGTYGYSVPTSFRTNLSNGTIYITISNFLADNFSYTSPANTDTTITRMGQIGDSVVIFLNSSGEYSTHLVFKNVVADPAFLGVSGWGQLISSTTDIVPYGTSTLYAGLFDTTGMGRFSLKNLLNKTLVVAFKVGTNTNASRIYDFNTGVTQSGSIGPTTGSSCMVLHINAVNQFAYYNSWYSGATSTTATTPTISTLSTFNSNTQYVTTVYFQSSTAVATLYSWNGSSFTQLYTTTVTYSTAGGFVNPLNYLRMLHFGRSLVPSDPIFSGSYQKILSYDGAIPNTSTLATIFTGASNNAASGTTYTFGAPAGFTSMSVKMWNTPATTTSQVTLSSASKQYLELTGLTILDEDKTEIYTASGTKIGTLPAVGQEPTEGRQTLMTSFSFVSVPGAPTDISGSAGNGQVSVSFSAPVDNGGSSITGYTVTSSPGNFTGTGSSSPISVSGLTNGTAYTFTVKATNIAGDSVASSSSSSLTPIAPSVSDAISESPASLAAFIASQPVSTDSEKVSVITTVRESLKNASYANDTEKAAAKKAYIDAMISTLGSSTYTVPQTDFSSFIATSQSSMPNLVAKPVNIIFPTFSGQSASVNISGVSNTSYTHIEVPVGYTINLTDGVTNVSILFTGISYTSGGNTYTPGSNIIVGSKTIQLVAIGGSTFQEGNNGGGGAGDPYITTVSNKSYKLPIMDAPIRFYQGVVDNKVLTVNATLKTISSKDLVAENIVSFLQLKDSLNPSQTKQTIKEIFEKQEILSFFEKVYIHYDNNELQLNVWNQKLEVESYKGCFKTSAHEDLSITSKCTNVYGSYKNQTLKIDVGSSASVLVSVYDAPMVRSGIFVEAPNMELGNGVIVNTLSPSAMTLSGVQEKRPVETNDSGIRKVTKEYFVDAAGYRTREIVSYM
jgi:hypothetical protein